MEVSKNDFIFFKNEILQDLKKLDSKINDKATSLLKELNEKTSIVDKKLTMQDNRITDIQNFCSTNDEKSKMDEKFKNFKAKLDEFIFINNTKVNSMDKQLSEMNLKYDKNFSTNLTVPRLIGSSCEYPNLRSFLEYVNTKLKDISNSVEKQEKEVKLLKNKISNMDNSAKISQDKLLIKVNTQLTQISEKNEIVIKDHLKLFQEKVDDIRLEGTKHMMEIEEKMKGIKIDWDKLLNIRQEIYDKFDSSINQYIEAKDNLVKEFTNYKLDFSTIKSRFKDLNESYKNFEFNNKNLASEYVTSKPYKESQKKSKDDSNDSIGNKENNIIEENEDKNIMNDIIEKIPKPKSRQLYKSQNVFYPKYKKINSNRPFEEKSEELKIHNVNLNFMPTNLSSYKINTIDEFPIIANREKWDNAKIKRSLDNIREIIPKLYFQNLYRTKQNEKEYKSIRISKNVDDLNLGNNMEFFKNNVLKEKFVQIGKGNITENESNDNTKKSGTLEDNFYNKLQKANLDMKNIYFEFNSKINHLSSQIDGLINEAFNYMYGQKFLKKAKTLRYKILNLIPHKNKGFNSSDHLNANNLNFPKNNNSNEVINMSTNDILQKMESYVFKRLKKH